MHITLLKPKAVRAILGRSRTTVYQDVLDGLLPPAIKTGARSVAFIELEIKQVLAARVAGLSDAEIKHLVQKQIRNRAALAESFAGTPVE